MNYKKQLSIFFAIFCSLLLNYCCLNSCFGEVAQFKIPDANESPRLVKVKLEFDSAQALIGVSENGYIKDSSKKYALSKLIKYQIKLNSIGTYDLFLVKGSFRENLGSLSLPFTLTTNLGDSPIYFNGHWYHGQVELNKVNTGIVAINGVDLENAIHAILSPFVRFNDSANAIKAASIIMRSSLFSLTLTSKDVYHLNGSIIGYQGIESEKDFVTDLVKSTEGQVILSPHGELLYTPIRVTARDGSVPFELIGQDTKAWEKVVSIDDAETILKSAGYLVGPIVTFEQNVLVSPLDSFPIEGGPFLSVEGTSGAIQMSLVKAAEVFKLPSPFFRVYSFNGNDGQINLQFIGSILNYPGLGSPPVLNIVRLIYESSHPEEDCAVILKDLYPSSYLSRI
jgi:hypothetical protein